MDLALHERAVEVLRNCVHESGLKASAHDQGHRQVWTRDSMIALLGARLSSDNGVLDALRRSLRLLREHQTPAGLIPNNVDAAERRPNFRAYADAGLWYVVGSALLDPHPESVRRTLAWYECQDVDQTGLLSMQEGSDWQDLFCTRGKGLYVNSLYVLALRLAGMAERAELVKEQINRFFWYCGDGNTFRHVAHSFSTWTTSDSPFDSLGRRRWLPRKRLLVDESYYLPYLSLREIGEWFDMFGNLMAILAGVADEAQTRTILNFIGRRGMDEWPVRALEPPVSPGDPDWRDYYGSLNLPHHYHNGGIWPFLGGFYVAALVYAGERQKAEAALERLGELNRQGNFNEWHHGQMAEPMGVTAQAWSAGMYLFAEECVRTGEVRLSP